MSDEETESCQEAIVVIGEASESEDDNSEVYKSNLSFDSKFNINNPSLSNSKSLSLKSTRSHQADCSTGKLSLKEDHFNPFLENSLITDRLVKENHLLFNSILNFSAQRYQKTINELNELNQNLIKSHEQIQSANQCLEKTKCNLSNLNDNLNEIFDTFDNCKLRI